MSLFASDRAEVTSWDMKFSNPELLCSCTIYEPWKDIDHAHLSKYITKRKNVLFLGCEREFSGTQGTLRSVDPPLLDAHPGLSF